jgi:hypothetical protein
MMNSQSRPSQHGQASVEFVVLSLVLVPLILIVPLLGKYMDIAQTTAVASRYVAFEGAARHTSSSQGWKTDAELTQEVQRRFFSNSDAPIKTKDTAGDFNAHRNTLWFNHRGDPLLPTFNTSVNVGTSKEGMSQPFGALFAGSFGLSQDNLYIGRVNVNIADVVGLQPFDTLGLTIARSTTLLADPWAAGGPATVRSKIQYSGAAFPYALLAGEAAVLSPFIALADLGHTSPPDVGGVSPDRVPADRLGAPR